MLRELRIGDMVAKLPIIQGGMGVGVSLSRLAGAVAKEGGVGVISTAQIGFEEPEFEKDQAKANLIAIKKHIKKAKEIACGHGMVGVNIMVALKHYKEREKAIVDTVMDKLYVGCGLRSLDPDHKDYHPIYIGSLSKRDHAYHQGTAWGFLLGGFISAYVKVNGRTKATALCADKLLDPVREHLLNNCIGSICEIFDGNAPHSGRGCYAQAWSVGEVLRCYCEDVLPMLPQAHS